jgi:hypothetical protein
MNRILFAFLFLISLPARADDSQGVFFNSTTGQLQVRTRAGGTKSFTVNRVETVDFSGTTEGTSCGTSTTCTITRQSTAGWVSSVTSGSTAGDYTVNFNPGVWTAVPTCTVTSYTAGNFANYASPSVNSISISTRLDNGTAVSSAHHVVCVGH